MSRTGIRQASVLMISAPACALHPKFLDGKTMTKATVRKQIERNWYRYRQSLLNGDAEGMAQIFAEDGILMEPDTEDLVGRDEIRAFAREALATMRIQAMRNQTREIAIYKNVAYELGTFEETLTLEEERTVTYPGRYFAVWKREGSNNWKLHRLLLNHLRPRTS